MLFWGNYEKEEKEKRHRCYLGGNYQKEDKLKRKRRKDKG
jgi:hypothetical protein